MLGTAGGAVVQVKLDLALASELGEVALGGRAADSDLFGDVRRRLKPTPGLEPGTPSLRGMRRRGSEWVRCGHMHARLAI
jgi:hypothetical protein